MAIDDASGGGGGGAMGEGGLGDANTTSGKKRMSEIDKARENIARSQGAQAAAGGGLDMSQAYIPGGMSQAAASSLIPSRPANPQNPNLWMGSQSPIAFMDYSDATNMYFMWDNKTRNKFMSQLALAGYDPSQMRDVDVAKAWAGYVGIAKEYQAAGKQISPWDVLGKDIAQRSAAASEPRTVKQTQKAYNISTAEDAAALFQGAAQTLLGRDPTKAEQSRFKAILNKYEQAHPSTTTTTSTYVGQDLQGQTSTTTGGVSAAAQQYVAQEEAKKNPEYGAYQAATNGMNWLMEMIGG